MPKKQQLSRPQPPSVTPERGIELLRRQQQRARQLLTNRPIDKGDYRGWQLTTRAHLVDSFGSDSPNVASVMNAGRLPDLLAEMPEEWWEEERASHLATQVKLLDSCIQQLEAKIEPEAVLEPIPASELDLASRHPKVAANCTMLFMTGEYESAVFNAMKCVEDEIRTRIRGDPTDIGIKLVSKAMGSQPPRLVFSKVDAEQDGAASLYRGAIAYLKNPRSHRFLDTSDTEKTLEILAFASLLMRMLDEATLEGA